MRHLEDVCHRFIIIPIKIATKQFSIKIIKTEKQKQTVRKEGVGVSGAKMLLYWSITLNV
jgi:hypothetical protein